VVASTIQLWFSPHFTTTFSRGSRAPELPNRCMSPDSLVFEIHSSFVSPLSSFVPQQSRCLNVVFSPSTRFLYMVPPTVRCCNISSSSPSSPSSFLLFHYMSNTVRSNIPHTHIRTHPFLSSSPGAAKAPLPTTAKVLKLTPDTSTLLRVHAI
jgi:hypothetical protein